MTSRYHMSKFKISIICTIVFLVMSTSTWATTYYVDASNGSDSYNGLFPRVQSGTNGPWETIRECTNSIKPGDTCQVQPGTYTENITETTDGSVGNEIIYQASGSGVVIRGNINITGDFVHFRGFEVTNGGFTLTKASHCLIENNFIHDTGNSVPVVMYASTKYSDDNSCSYNTIRNNKITKGYDVGVSTAGQHHTIEGNEIYEMAGGNHDGIHFHGGNHIIRGNYIHNNVHPTNADPHIDCFQAWRTAHDTIFEKNICVNTNTTKSNQIVMLEEFVDQDGDVHDLTFRNNIFDFSDPGYCPLRINQKNSGREIENIEIYNNTFIHRNVSGKGEAALSFVRINGVKVRNNIVYNFGDGSSSKNWFTCVTCQDVSVSNNLIYADDNDPPRDCFNTDGVCQEDPKFVNFSAHDYHLQAGSPAIDAGYHIGVTEDFDNISRPQNGIYDIGAYEYVADGPETLPIPSAPQNLKIIKAQ